MVSGDQCTLERKYLRIGNGRPVDGKSRPSAWEPCLILSFPCPGCDERRISDQVPGWPGILALEVFIDFGRSRAWMMDVAARNL